MIKVKVTHPYGNWPLARQTPNNSGIWGDCQFFINDDTQECDYWFVFDDLLKEESVICNPKNTVIITLEFPAIRPDINLKFLNQFDTIFTYSRNIDHPKVINTFAPFPTMIGVNNTNGNTVMTAYKNYDELSKPLSINKVKLISVISSNKAFTEGHRKRLRFVQALQEHFGKNIDIFGRGIKDFEDKWDVIAPYKYHIAIENSSCYNGMSEKLYDSFIGESLPFYYGCPNVSDYFPRESFIKIDIDDIERSIKIIESSITIRAYESSTSYIRQSKNLVLKNYNIFKLMENHCKRKYLVDEKYNAKSLLKLLPESYFNISNKSKIKRFLKEKLNATILLAKNIVKNR